MDSAGGVEGFHAWLTNSRVCVSDETTVLIPDPGGQSIAPRFWSNVSAGRKLVFKGMMVE